MQDLDEMDYSIQLQKIIDKNQHKKLQMEAEKKVEKKQMMDVYSDRIIIRKIDLDFKSEGGIFLGTIDKESECIYGKVVAVGPGKQIDTSGIIPMRTKVGDILVIKGNLPMKMNIKGLEYFTLRESDVILRLNDEAAVEREFTSEGTEYDIIGSRILS